MAVANYQSCYNTAIITSVKSIINYKHMDIVKHLFGLDFIYCSLASSYLHVVYTSTDPSQHFTAPFKVGKSRHAQSCYISQNYNTKKLHCYNWFIPLQISSGEMRVLVTLTQRASNWRCSLLRHAVCSTLLSYDALSLLCETISLSHG
jgi:hypothetical protein